jgi:hypothetical protein
VGLFCFALGSHRRDDAGVLGDHCSKVSVFCTFFNGQVLGFQGLAIFGCSVYDHKLGLCLIDYHSRLLAERLQYLEFLESTLLGGRQYHCIVHQQEAVQLLKKAVGRALLLEVSNQLIDQ